MPFHIFETALQSLKASGLEEGKIAVWRVCWFAKQIIFQSQLSPPTRPKGEYFHNKMEMPMEHTQQSSALIYWKNRKSLFYCEVVPQF